MTEIEKIFTQIDNTFTVFVVEQRFAVGRGAEFFRSYRNTSNFINSDEQLKKVFSKAVETISKNVSPIEKLVKLFLSGFSGLSIAEAITSLCQLFTVNEHQLAGPDVIDPIILQEGKITKKTIAHLVSINKDSIIRPSIIILLKDNDFDRAKLLLAECPNDINVKMIYNDGREELYKIVNCGADDIVSFINSFSKQCYCTCANTRSDLILNSEWAENSIIKQYSPILFKYRSNLICDQKDNIREELSAFINNISAKSGEDDNQERIIRSFECISKLYRVFCNDLGGLDILEAKKIAQDLNHELLLAQVYRYAEFLPDCSANERVELYQKGIDIFYKYSMEDHAIYCKNNMLVEQFYSNNIEPEKFKDMQVEAVNNVPGMTALSHIYNNVGVAYLYCGFPEKAIDYFNRGLEHAQSQSRIVQNLALETNKMVAESYSFNKIDENRIFLLARRIFDGMGKEKLPFLASDYILNVLSIAYKQNKHLGQELNNSFPIQELLQKGFDANVINASERLLQMQYLTDNYGNAFPLLDRCNIPTGLKKSSGKRMDFILRYGLNPFDFEIWL